MRLIGQTVKRMGMHREITSADILKEAQRQIDELEGYLRLRAWQDRRKAG